MESYEVVGPNQECRKMRMSVIKPSKIQDYRGNDIQSVLVLS